jgi:transcription factor SPN1
VTRQDAPKEAGTFALWTLDCALSHKGTTSCTTIHSHQTPTISYEQILTANTTLDTQTYPRPANDKMEDLEVPGGSPVQQNGQEPEGNNDPGDILKPEIEEEHTRTPPLADPADDLDAHDEAPPATDDEAEPNNDPESDLDDLDEAQFDDFNPESATINVPDQPVAVDESNVGLLGVHKRKRAEGEDGERQKKKKEGRREKKSKKVRAGGDDEDDFEGGPEIEGSRRKKSGTAAKKAPRARSPENEENLSPEERKFR